MKKILLLLAALTVFTAPAFAQKISALPSGSAVSNTDLLPDTQGYTGTGTGTTVSITAAQLKTFMSASPTLVTPLLGVATGTSFNGLTITTTTGTLSLANGKTLTSSNTLTFGGTDGSTVAFGSGGTVAYLADNLSLFASTTSAQLKSIMSDATGTGSLVFANSPTLITPSLGAATATSINGTAIPSSSTGTGALVLAMSPALITPSLGVATATSLNGNTITTGTGTLTLGAGKTFTASNTLTFAGTDGSTLNIGTGGTLEPLAYVIPGTGVASALGNATNGSSGLQVADSTGNVPNAVSRACYVMANFQSGGTTGTERGQILLSFDAIHWTQIHGLENYSPTTGGMRDLGLVRVGTTWYLTYTDISGGTCEPYFGVATSTNLVNWTHVTDITPTGNTHPIADPKIFTDTNGNRYVSYYDQTAGTVSVVQDTSGNMSAFSAPTNITPTSVTAWDPYIYKQGSTYYLFTHPSGYSSTYHCYTSTTLLASGSNWTDNGVITNWGDAEAAMTFIGPDGNYWAEMNGQGTYEGWVYSESSSLTSGWSTLNGCVQPAFVSTGTAGADFDGGTVIAVTDSNTIVNLLAAAINMTQPQLALSYNGNGSYAGTGYPTLSSPLTLQFDQAGQTAYSGQLVILGKTAPAMHLDIGYDTTNSVGYINAGGVGAWSTLDLETGGGGNVVMATNGSVTMNSAGGGDIIMGTATAWGTFTESGSSFSSFQNDGQYQLFLRGKTVSNKYLLVGFDTTNNMGYIDAEWSTNTTEPIALNPGSQKPILIGTETINGTAALQLGENGNIYMSGLTANVPVMLNNSKVTVSVPFSTSAVSSTLVYGGNAFTGSTASQTETLPAPIAGGQVFFKNQSNVSVTVSSASGSQIMASGSASAAATVTVASGASVDLYGDGTYWNQ